jgi:hypothetical protein
VSTFIGKNRTKEVKEALSCEIFLYSVDFTPVYVLLVALTTPTVIAAV